MQIFILLEEFILN